MIARIIAWPIVSIAFLALIIAWLIEGLPNESVDEYVKRTITETI